VRKVVIILLILFLLVTAGVAYLYLTGNILAGPLRDAVKGVPVLGRMWGVMKPAAARGKSAPSAAVTANGTGGAGAATTGADGGTPGKMTSGAAATWADLQRRGADLEAKEKVFTARQEALAQAERQLAADREAFEKARLSVDKLAQMYEAMKPAEAAAILAKLPERQAAILLARMEVKLAGRVLACLDPTAAARLMALMGGN
jgi:flagellar motility protein MotE (MotC chaperone)